MTKYRTVRLAGSGRLSSATLREGQTIFLQHPFCGLSSRMSLETPSAGERSAGQTGTSAKRCRVAAGGARGLSRANPFDVTNSVRDGFQRPHTDGRQPLAPVPPPRAYMASTLSTLLDLPKPTKPTHPPSRARALGSGADSPLRGGGISSRTRRPLCPVRRWSIPGFTSGAFGCLLLRPLREASV